MDLQTILDNACLAKRQETLKTSKQMTIGEIILKLEAINKTDEEVWFDFEYARPTDLDSWRGIYAEIAFGFDCETKPKTVKEILVILKEAIGKTYTGYKGGDFTMGKNTPVWVANYGNSGETGIVDIVDGGYKVILITGICEI